MASRKKVGAAPSLSSDLLAQFAKGLQPVHKDATQVYRGQERLPLIAFRTPAYGRLTAHTIGLTVRCCDNRNLGTKTPAAFRLHQNPAMPDLLGLEPLVTFDSTATDQYEIKWSKGNTQAHIDLLPVLQPRNMETPEGYVYEMPVSLENLPDGGGSMLILHVKAAELRAIQSTSSTEETAAAEQE